MIASFSNYIRIKIFLNRNNLDFFRFGFYKVKGTKSPVFIFSAVCRIDFGQCAICKL